MSDNLVERVTLRDKAVLRYQFNKHAYTDVVDAAIAVALEEAAKVAEGMWWQGHGNLATAPYAAAEQAGDEIAAAIRALITKENT